MVWIGYVIYGVYAICSLWLLVNALVQLQLLWYAKARNRQKARPALSSYPFITVQVPVYNEKYVVEALLHALAGLDYPKDRYEVQVLDDSTDETSALIDKLLPALRAEGLQADVVRRPSREGYKAGALQHGLAFCRGEYIAILDADFQPPPHFLKALMANFTDEKTGLVQARWGHLNGEQNTLTRIQTYLLDMHFCVEQAGRFNAGHFINFCGTAGIWRKRCIQEAGGWDGGVLSEDLDLSYRAQLKGWRIVYDNNVEVPAQLPAAMGAFRIQQFRWTKGIAQTARKNLGEVWRSPAPLGKKLHAFFHLTNSFSFVCLFVSALLTVPLLQLRQRFPVFVQLTGYSVVGALNLMALCFLYYFSCRAATLKGWRFARFFPIFLVVYLALSAQNAVAVLQGLSGRKSPFVRTPKAAANKANGYLQTRVSWITALEGSLLLYFLYGIALSFYHRDYFLLLFFTLMVGGLGTLLGEQWPAVRSLIGGVFVLPPRWAKHLR